MMLISDDLVTHTIISKRKITAQWNKLSCSLMERHQAFKEVLQPRQLTKQSFWSEEHVDMEILTCGNYFNSMRIQQSTPFMSISTSYAHCTQEHEIVIASSTLLTTSGFQARVNWTYALLCNSCTGNGSGNTRSGNAAAAATTTPTGFGHWRRHWHWRLGGLALTGAAHRHGLRSTADEFAKNRRRSLGRLETQKHYYKR